MAGSPRAFVLRHTRLRPVPGSRTCACIWPTRSSRCGTPSRSRPATRMPPCRTGRSRGAAGSRSGATCAEHPEAVAGRRVFDLASGSGLCAIAAMRAGAAAVTGCRHRSVRRRGVPLNARANGVRVRRHRAGRARRGATRGRRHPRGRHVVRRRAGASASCRGCVGRATRASTSSSAIRAGATCRPTSSSSSPPTTSGRRPSSRTSSSPEARVYRLRAPSGSRSRPVTPLRSRRGAQRRDLGAKACQLEGDRRRQRRRRRRRIGGRLRLGFGDVEGETSRLARMLASAPMIPMPANITKKP